MAPRGNALGFANRTKTTPIPVQRTTRNMAARVLTSLPAGKMVPIMAIPLLREDSVTSANYRLAFEMNETVEVLMNAVNVRVMAYLVPKLAFSRFDGMDSLNKSYEGLPPIEGQPVVPWFKTFPMQDPGVHKVLYYMGKHARKGQLVNTEYLEAYNAIWNFRAKNRSKDIPLRVEDDGTLAPAFWDHQTFAHIVPDFDQAVIDGEVALNVIPPAGGKYAVLQGLGLGYVGASPAANVTSKESDGTTRTYPNGWPVMSTQETPTAAQAGLVVRKGQTGYPDMKVDVSAVFAEMVEQGVTVSLSNIELARKTQAFANLRRQYAGHSEEYLIDLLMDGIAIPEEMWKQPILLADVSTAFGMSKRYASDAPNLTESVVNGLTYVDVRFSCPRVNTGGVIMIVAEIAPEQLFERQRDPYFTATSVDRLPQFLRDTLDPEKVSVVNCEDIDIDHGTPTATFGYAPLNWEWAKSMPQIGGKFHRPTVDAAFDEDRQRIWAVETKNPTLSKDFYLVSAMHYKPFVVTDLAIDPFETLVRGQCVIRGNTVFGGLLVEAENDYAEVMEEAPTDRIDKPE